MTDWSERRKWTVIFTRPENPITSTSPDCCPAFASCSAFKFSKKGGDYEKNLSSRCCRWCDNWKYCSTGKRKTSENTEILNNRNHFGCSRTNKLRVQTVIKGWGWSSYYPGSLLLGRLQDSNSQGWRRIGCLHCRRHTGKGHDLLHWTRHP